MTQRRAYAGIGSRDTPEDILELMTAAAGQLEQAGLILRSGGATGADTAFSVGVTDPANKQIILPYGGFNRHRGWEPGNYLIPTSHAEKITKIAAKHHPAWKKLEANIREFHKRNVCQVLGLTLDDPALFVLCWTPKGSGSGGTGQAIRVANAYGIRVLDMGAMTLPDIEEAIGNLINTGT